jgi:hypothetical protein
VVPQLEPAIRLAYLSFAYAESKAQRRLEDQEAYAILEDSISRDADDLEELSSYSVPTFDTWSRYLREARNTLGEQKYTRRSGRTAGRSVVTSDQAERRNRDGD